MPSDVLERGKRHLTLALLALGLTACGGAEDSNSGAGGSSNSETTMRADPDISAVGTVAPPAWLTTRSLEAAEEAALAADATASDTPLEDLVPGAIAPKSAYASGEVARKAAATRIPAYRFYNTRTGAHFYTTSEAERTTVATTLSPPFRFEGPAFSVASAFSPGLSPVHRFYNTQSGVHFYTISETERASVVANLPQFRYEGVAYHASQVAGQGLTPLYRFFVPSRGFHFYTASLAERDNIIARLSAAYTYEGVGYHVLAGNWRAEKLPHTGVTGCYRVDPTFWGVCDRAGVIELNPQQDGHRAAINPMRYENLPSMFGPYSYTSCVRDSVTGLVWEGKTVAGSRAGSHSYTHLGNNETTDVSGHVAAVNASALCGFSDWRLPTRQELLNLVNFAGGLGPNLNATYFPNTPADAVYWASEADRLDTTRAWYVPFGNYPGISDSNERTFARHLRLVRGDPPSASVRRFTFSTVAYGSDAANNLVNDAWTGLQWRRCEEGRTWSGTSCLGSGSDFSHANALAHARDQMGWRLPNVKELASLTDLSVVNLTGTALDLLAFPGAHGSSIWTSTGYLSLAETRAWTVNFYGGSIQSTGRAAASARVRLVRFHP
jgi:hypothetical protein